MDLERWGGELVRSWMKAWILHVHSIYDFVLIFYFWNPLRRLMVHVISLEKHMHETNKEIAASATEVRCFLRDESV